MCLLIRALPKSKKDGLIVISDKDLSYGTETPYLGIIIPNDGWLFAKYKKKRAQLYDEIAGAGVHAWRHLSSRNWTYNSYSIGVIGYGYNDIASVALYLPHADKTKSNIKEKLDRLLKRKELRIRDLKGIHPKLDIRLDWYKELDIKK